MAISSYLISAVLIQITLAFFSFQLESGGSLNTAYSKFRFGSASTGASATAAKAMFPSRKGMFALYTAPYILASFLFFLGTPSSNDLSAGLVLSFCFGLHFFKRMMEVLYIHSYSGPMELNAVFIIATTYSLDVLMTFIFANNEKPLDPVVFMIGYGIFIFGLAGNLFHHYLLSQIPRDKGGYSLPSSFLFTKIIMPHYFFEIIAYTGLWIATGFNLYFLATLIRVASYLSGRAIATKQWYLKKMPEHASTIESRYAIFPFIL